MPQPTTRATLTVKAARPCELPATATERMWELYRSHYENVHRDTFLADLEEKDEVFVARDRHSGDIVGFSTSKLYEHRYRGTKVGVYFSGDTIILPAYWGQTAFHTCVASRLARWKLRRPSTPLYWFLICSGYRTYLMMARNIPDHYPHFQRPCPDWERGLIDELCRARYGASWRPELGVVRCHGAQVRLHPSVAPFTESVTSLPEVDFFLRANPGCHDGDELAVIGHMNLRAFRHIAVKFAGKTLCRWRRQLAGERKPALPATRVVPPDQPL